VSKASRPPRRTESGKDRALETFRERPDGTYLTTDQGVRISHTDDSLKAGQRGPTLLEDFHLREKIMRFDHERIPERVVHARGSAAHGFFQVYESMAAVTRASFLQDPRARTPVFVRFSTVAGSRGSADTVRDVRGFAVKFYTDEGNFDLVGNNIPVFFIQDGVKFPDFVHAVKPEPQHEMPQAASAHDTFWDFVALQPETLHMVMWVMSDRAIPRSYRTMEGFGVHTFRFVNARGKATLVKFHWKPLLGVHSLVWDEAQKISGADPDFHRRDLWEAIEHGLFPEYELGVQLVEEKDELKYGFDMLDATKLLPEELVPVRRIGKLTLDRNPDNFFAETEQVAFCVGNVVPGIDFTNDPLMQARLFSYLDTQLSRLGGPNFAEIPINRPVAPVHNHQQDGAMRTTINTGKALYHPNSVGGGCPFLASPDAGAYVHHMERVEGHKIRQRSESFKDHFGQASMFFRSLSAPEQQHLIEACQFELGKVERREIRERVVEHFARIDGRLATAVAARVGVAAPRSTDGGTAAAFRPSPALSMARTVKDTPRGRRIAALVAPGVAARTFAAVRKELEAAGAQVDVIGPALGVVATADGAPLEANRSLVTVKSVLYDAVLVPGGAAAMAALGGDDDARDFIDEAYKHFKPIGALDEGVELLKVAGLAEDVLAPADGAVASRLGVVIGRGASGRGVDARAFAQQFSAAIAAHRHWERGDAGRPVPEANRPVGRRQDGKAQTPSAGERGAPRPRSGNGARNR
jgi:catalase